MELKERIIQKINKIQDKQALEQLEKLLNAFSDMEGEFSKEEINSVMEGYSQYEKGDLINKDEVNRSFEEWRKGK